MEAPQIESDSLEAFASTLKGDSLFPSRINLEPEKVEQGLVKLVLTLVELIRQLLERQAIRRMEGGTLTKEEIERLGMAFMKLAQKMEELKEHFEIDDLNIDLGPLGKLLD
ncbi:MAG: gas vesicle protein K [Candidatus Tectomicrobia bacterium]|nr:gas vesicle protein K [Candidatus Tectomicrobia bacterium]